MAASIAWSRLVDGDVDSFVRTVHGFLGGEGGGGGGVEVVVALDVGATNTRVVVEQRAGETTATTTVTTAAAIKWHINSARVLLQHLQLLADVLPASAVVAGAALAITGPHADGVVHGIANFVGGGDHQRLRLDELPIRLFPVGRTRLLNDVEACCYGVLSVAERGEWHRYFRRLWDGGVDGAAGERPLDARKSYALINVGTGLGNALLLSPASVSGRAALAGGCESPQWHDVLPTESGHQTITQMCRDEGDFQFSQWLRQRTRDGAHDVEWDDVGSGRGIEACYAWCVQQQAGDEGAPATPAAAAADISAAALAFAQTGGRAMDARRVQPALAFESMLRHYRWLMRFTQNYCIALQCRGLILCGDNTARNAALIQLCAGDLRAAFLDHSMERLGWMTEARAAAWLQVHPLQLTLLGALGMARRAAQARAT